MKKKKIKMSQDMGLEVIEINIFTIKKKMKIKMKNKLKQNMIQ